MATLTEQDRTGDVVLFEGDNRYSREAVTIAAGQTLEVGAVLGKVTASGEYIASAPGASDGSETPIAVLVVDAIDTTVAAAEAVVIARHARVRRAGLNFHASIDTTAERDAAVAALRAAGIIAA